MSPLTIFQVAGHGRGMEGSRVLCFCLPAAVCRRDPHGTRMCSKAKQVCEFALEPLSTLGNIPIAAAAPNIKPESVSF